MKQYSVLILNYQNEILQLPGFIFLPRLVLHIELNLNAILSGQYSCIC